MPQHQQEKEIPKQFARKVSLGTIVEMHISDVMQDRSKMKAMENDLDAYLKTLTPEEKEKNRDEIKRQLTDGRLALESLLQRFLAS